MDSRPRRRARPRGRAGRLRGDLRAAVSVAEAVLVDLGELEFIDSSGVTMLLKTVGRQDRGPRRLRIVNVSGQVERAVSLMNLGRRLGL